MLCHLSVFVQVVVSVFVQLRLVARSLSCEITGHIQTWFCARCAIAEHVTVRTAPVVQRSSLLHSQHSSYIIV